MVQWLPHGPNGAQVPSLVGELWHSMHGHMGFPGGSDGKNSAFNAGDMGSIPWSGRYPGEGNGYPLQYSCLENSIDRGDWQATVHGLQKNWT